MADVTWTDSTNAVFNSTIAIDTDPLRDRLSGEMSAVVSAVIIGLIIFTVLGNVLTICAVCVDQRLRTSPSNVYIASLSIADLTVGTVVMTLMYLYSTSDDGRWHYGPIACDIWNFTDYVACTASLTNVCAVTVDRYRSVSQPLQAISRRSHRRALLESAVAWLFPLTFWSLLIVVVRNLHGHPGNSRDCQLLSQPQYGAVLCAVVAVNVPIVFIIVYFTAILISLRRQLGKHHQAARHQRLPSRPASSPTLLSPASEGDRANGTEDNWDSDDVQTVEMTDMVSQGQLTTSFYVEPEEPTHASSTTSDHRLHTNNNSYIAVSNGDAHDSDGITVMASGMLRRLLANHKLKAGTPCQRRVQRGYVRASMVTCLDDDSDDSEDDGSEERIKIVRLCTEEIEERRELSNGVQVTHPGSSTLHTSFTAFNDIRLTSSVAIKARSKPNHACSLPVVQQLLTTTHNNILSEEDEYEMEGEDKKSGVSASPLGRCASQRIVTAQTSTVPRSSSSTARPLHTCSSDPAFSTLLQRTIVGNRPVGAGRLSLGTAASHLHHQQQAGVGGGGGGGQAGRVRSASQPVASFSKALWGRRRRDSVEKARVRQQVRAAVTLGVITLCMLCCWLPFSVVWPWRIFCPSCVPNYVYDLATWVNYANSAINPCIYCLTNPLYRQAFRRIFVRFLCRRQRVWR